jgi:hypothetical protein
MPNNSGSNVVTADALTLLLHNQHALAAAIEGVTKWLSENGGDTVTVSAMETIERNAEKMTKAIMQSRQS